MYLYEVSADYHTNPRLPVIELGIFDRKALNPKSNVIPLCRLWGFLSREAVDKITLNAFTTRYENFNE